MTKRCRQLPSSLQTPTGRPLRPNSAASENISLLCPKVPQLVEPSRITAHWAHCPVHSVLTAKGLCRPCRSFFAAIGCPSPPYAYRNADPDVEAFVIDTETTGFTHSDSVVEFAAVELGHYGWLTTDVPYNARPCWRCDLKKLWARSKWDSPISNIEFWDSKPMTSRTPNENGDLGLPCLFWPTGEVWQGYARPEKNFNHFARRVTGLSEEELQNEMPVADLLACAAFGTSNKFVFAHNAAFDTRMIEKTVGNIWDPLQTICTMRLAKNFFPGERCDLNSCINRFRVDPNLVELRETSFHGAVLDARVTTCMLQALQDYIAASYGLCV